MLGLQVPIPEHFRTQVARVIFDMGEPEGRLSLSLQKKLHNTLLRLVGAATTRSSVWLPLLRRIDRWIMGNCAGSVKREILADLCAKSPHLLNSMPQCRRHVQALSRALFLSAVLNPAALRRIEEAIKAEMLQSTGTTE